jgi:hypothetical protein
MFTAEAPSEPVPISIGRFGVKKYDNKYFRELRSIKFKKL